MLCPTDVLHSILIIPRENLGVLISATSGSASCLFLSPSDPKPDSIAGLITVLTFHSFLLILFHCTLTNFHPFHASSLLSRSLHCSGLLTLSSAFHSDRLGSHTCILSFWGWAYFLSIPGETFTSLAVLPPSPCSQNVISKHDCPRRLLSASACPLPLQQKGATHLSLIHTTLNSSVTLTRQLTSLKVLKGTVCTICPDLLAKT